MKNLTVTQAERDYIQNHGLECDVTAMAAELGITKSRAAKAKMIFRGEEVRARDAARAQMMADVEVAIQDEIAQAAAEELRQNPPATAKQIAYLVKLRVAFSDTITKREASILIDAAKNGDLGSVGAFYTDGSN